MTEVAPTFNELTQAAPARGRLKWLHSGVGLLTVATVACWALFFNQLSGEWAINAQYSYGYVVPLLGLALLWRRWPERPAPVPTPTVGLSGVCAAGLLLLVLPFELVLEANPEWRLIYWLNGFQVVGLGFCVLYWLGGKQWVKYFAPPLVFMLIAVPWPMNTETSIIQGLMRFVAGLTVEVAGWLGIPAVQHGNLIEVGAGMVGIDEACSGVRSLQSALMLSLFLGEMNRFTWRRRVALLVASLLLVLAANLTRTSFLVWMAANHGMDQMRSWHDTAGMVIMLIVLPCLVLLATLMKPKDGPEEKAATPLPVIGATGRAVMPRWAGVAALAWVVTAQASTEVWYRTHETRLIANPRWS